MMTLPQSLAITGIAKHLYGYLPGKPHPRADPKISFRGVAEALNLGKFWKDGSKLPALTALLESTFEWESREFGPLIVEIVRSGIKYCSSKTQPITREQIESLNALLMQLGMRLPELVDRQFLSSLPMISKKLQISQRDLDACMKDLLNLTSLPPHPRGFAFEKFLQEMFRIFGLDPHVSFRLVGEQIDGSLNLDNETYLIEARWRNERVALADLLTLDGKVSGKSTWSRGIMISYSGFTQDGLEAYSHGRPSRLICLSGEDLAFVLEGKISLTMALRQKARLVAERGVTYVPLREIQFS